MSKYKDEEYRGYTIDVCYDPDPQSPREWSQVAKLYSFNRDYEFDKHDYRDFDCLLVDLMQDLLPELYDELYEKDLVWYSGDTWYFDDDAVKQRAKEALEDVVMIAPIAYYSHGGTTIWLGTPNDRWDSGIMGVAVQTKDDTIKMCGSKPEDWKDAAIKNMELEVQELDMVFRGEVYGFIVKDKDGDEIDSCWGFFGDDGITEAISEAKGIIDSEIRHRVMGDERNEPMLFTYEEMCSL